MIDPSNYYDKGGINTLDVIRAKLTKEQYIGYLLGNLIKYTHRMNWKEAREKDAIKAKDYAVWLDTFLRETSYDK